jgi:hypothetical protein
MAPANPVEILSRLAAGKVDFIVVGMVAGVLRGAPDRHDPRRLRPGPSHLVGPGHQLLTTNKVISTAWVRWVTGKPMKTCWREPRKWSSARACLFA